MTHPHLTMTLVEVGGYVEWNRVFIHVGGHPVFHA